MLLAASIDRGPVFLIVGPLRIGGGGVMGGDSSPLGPARAITVCSYSVRIVNYPVKANSTERAGGVQLYGCCLPAALKSTSRNSGDRITSGRVKERQFCAR